MLAHSEPPPVSFELGHDIAAMRSMDHDAEQLHHDESFSDGEDDAELGEGDYSRHLEDILSDGGLDEDEHTDSGIHMEDDDDEGFVYTGVDTEEPVGGYQDQLKDVLGEDHDDESEDARIVEKSLAHEAESTSFSVDDLRNNASASEQTPSTSSVPVSPPFSPFRMASPALNGTSIKTVRPFLHPTVSRLRSFVPRPTQERVASETGHNTLYSHAPGAETPSASHISAFSPTTSVTNLDGTSSTAAESEREVFRWTALRNLETDLYSKKLDKAKAVLGARSLGSPTVLAANGLICVGTDSGRVAVYDFKQQLKCICADENNVRLLGPVTAVALSQDHTFVAVGHAYGHIQLFDIQQPQKAARTVNPTSLAAVASGRQEGHLAGSRILQLGFIAGRHTAIISADDQGLAFYHSLGKVLFVEASDILRILGKYPEENPISTLKPANGSLDNGSQEIPQTPPPLRRRHRPTSTILAMGPLPLGTSPHPSDGYQLIALLTPVKLVVVGLKPSPKTWFRVHRDVDDDVHRSKSKWSGCLAWFPSINDSPNGAERETPSKKEKFRKNQINGKGDSSSTAPLLAYSWGRTFHLLRVSETRIIQRVRNKNTQKEEKVEAGKVNFQEYWSCSSTSDILALQWLNVNQVLAFTASTIELYDARQLKLTEKVSFDSLSLISPWLRQSADGSIAYHESQGDIAHSVRVYKGKIFTLGYEALRVGTLLTWADRILSFVECGDFLSAIDLARAYYLGQAEGNTNGLPEDQSAMRAMVGQKIQELQVASARYAFSNERLTDTTHVTADNRGVDRTKFFEGLVVTAVKSCIALNNFDFLFEELFQWYDNWGISRMYLKELEPLVLDNSIHFVPPRITQKLVAMHAEDGHLNDVERIIWHIDPECLDIDQVITLCQRYHLYDALIYVYTRALRDYVSPVVELLGLVRAAIRSKNDSLPRLVASDNKSISTQSIENLVVHAYKVYPYLENVLSGLTYPSGRPLPAEEVVQAHKDVYTFLFHSRPTIWPAGEGGQRILTTDNDGGVEPTYPYAKLLLRFDAEAFLHTLDIAFEHSYLNDDSQGVSRQIIANILLDIVSASETTLPSSDMTFVNIFLARNVPKYPQFIHLTPSSLQAILVRLAIDLDQSTREDRQLAAEYLLSVYTPHDGEHILSLLESAGFFRIARSWYRQERRWVPLLKTFLHDPDLNAQELFNSFKSTLEEVSNANKKQLPDEITITVIDALPTLLQTSIPHTALLVDQYAPDSHSKVIQDMGTEADHKRFAYLRCLLGPPKAGEEDDYIIKPNGPSRHVNKALRQLYLSLLCRYDTQTVIEGLRYLPLDSFEASDVVRICEVEQVYDAAVWILDQHGLPLQSLTKIDNYTHGLVREVAEHLHLASSSPDSNMRHPLSEVQSLVRMGITICLKHSRQPVVEVPLEDLWFKLLSCQIDSVQAISGLAVDIDPAVEVEGPTNVDYPLTCLRDLVQETFANLVSVSSTKAVSFPRLFKRLVDSTSKARIHSGTPYNEFRSILTGMLESYNSDGDLLKISRRLAQRDLFDAMDDLVGERAKGWASSHPVCVGCGKSCLPRPLVQPAARSVDYSDESLKLIVSRTGTIYHRGCFPASS